MYQSGLNPINVWEREFFRRLIKTERKVLNQITGIPIPSRWPDETIDFVITGNNERIYTKSLMIETSREQALDKICSGRYRMCVTWDGYGEGSHGYKNDRRLEAIYGEGITLDSFLRAYPCVTAHINMDRTDNPQSDWEHYPKPTSPGKRARPGV